MSLKSVFPYLCLLVLLIGQFNFGSDLTHHLHNSWIYNKMIIEQRFIPYDPYLLSGEQITFAYGLIAYPISGLFWFIAKDYSVDILMALCSILAFFLIKNLLKQDFPTSILTLSMLYNVLGDTYVFYVSNVLFYLGLYLYYNHKRFWQVPIILACLNHPVTIIAATYFILKDKRLFSVLFSILAYFLVVTFFFSKTATLTFYLPIVFLTRLFMLLFPVFFIEDIYSEFYNTIYHIHKTIGKYTKSVVIKKVSNDILQKSKKQIPIIRHFMDTKIPLSYMLLIEITTVFLAIVIMQLFFQTWNYSLYTFKVDSVLFNSFPNITGNIRVVDYAWIPSLLFSKENITFYGGSFRENSNNNFSPNLLTNDSYYASLRSSNVTYVLVCKQCSMQNNELELLRSNFILYWENDYYYLYKVA